MTRTLPASRAEAALPGSDRWDVKLTLRVALEGGIKASLTDSSAP